jgi:hypothetical protein
LNRSFQPVARRRLKTEGWSFDLEYFIEDFELWCIDFSECDFSRKCYNLTLGKLRRLAFLLGLSL